MSKCFVPSRSNVRTLYYSVWAFLTVGIVLTVLAKHNSNMSSTIVKLNMGKSIRRKKVVPKFLTKSSARLLLHLIDIHMIELTVNKEIFYLAAIEYTNTTVLSVRLVGHRCGRGCSGTATSRNVSATVGAVIWNSFRCKNFELNILTKTLAQNFGLWSTSIW